MNTSRSLLLPVALLAGSGVLCLRSPAPPEATPGRPGDVLPTGGPPRRGPASPADPLPAAAPARPAAPTPAHDKDAALRALPAAEQRSLWQAFSAARHAVEPLTAHDRAMPENQGVACFARNPGQRLAARFLTAGGVRLGAARCGRGWQATLELAAGGPALAVVSDGNRVEARHPGGLTEWFENRPEGLEHGFTVAGPRGGDGVLEIPLALAGLRSQADPRSPGDLCFVDDHGAPVLGYRDLKAWDAAGRRLPAGMAPAREGAGVSITVCDAGACYPVTIDPLLVSFEAELNAGFGAPYDHFGDAVALDGDTAVVGARENDTAAGENAGSVYVFTRSGSGWSMEATLTAPDATSWDLFGWSVAVAGDTALVGALRGDTAAAAEAGCVYVFTRSGKVWSGQAKLAASDGESGDSFGDCLAFSGDSVLIGAPHDDTAAGWDAGSAYVFTRTGTTWSEQAQLTAGDGAPQDWFGSSLALSGDTALVGASMDDTAAGWDAGSAYVFTRSGTTWSEQAQLTAGAEASADGHFGFAVALAGDTALVGAYGADPAAGTNAGCAWVFTRSGAVWSEQARLTAADGMPGDYFGVAVALAADTALIGTGGDDTEAGSDTGSAYVFARSGGTWHEEAKLTAPDAATGDGFGGRVALCGDTALIGARMDDTASGFDGGSAWVFTRSGGTWSPQAKLEPVPGDAATGDGFGLAVALAGDTALVGACGDDSGYVLVRGAAGEWTQQARLTPADGATGEQFGIAVALAGDTALVGARYHRSGEDWPGGAYVFTRAGGAWAQQAILMAADGESGDYFGTSVALSGDTALVGAMYATTMGGDYAGRAYVFVRNDGSWVQAAKLTASDGAEGDHFGNAVALSGDTALIGAEWDDTAAGDWAGSAYIFARNGTAWSERAQLTAGSEGAGDDCFGHSVALCGNTAVIGAYAADTAAGSLAGRAYVFERVGVTWMGQGILTPADAAAGDCFGVSVAVDGDTALVGAYGVDTAAGNVGGAYVFQRTGSTWTERAKLLAPDGAYGDYFGDSVAVCGDLALVGARSGDTWNATDCGSVYVFSLTAVPTFEEWAGAAGLTGADDAGPSAIPFGDGVENLLKYAFNLTGSGPDRRVLVAGTGTAGLPCITLDRSVPALRFEYLRRKGSGLTYIPQLSTDLIAWQPLAATPVVADIDAAWERVVIAEPCDPATIPRLFGRVAVVLPP